MFLVIFNLRVMLKKIVGIVVFVFMFLGACDVDEGYLIADETAGFSIDSLLVYANPPVSSSQYKYETPYFTTSVEGVEGTKPLIYSLYDVTSEDGDVVAMREQMEVKTGIGKISIPAKHTIPAGTYWVSLRVENCYSFIVLENIVKIVVK